MTESVPTKWAATEANADLRSPVTSLIMAATSDEDSLFFRALADAIESMGQYAVVGRSLADATALLDQIRCEFERKAGQR